MKYDKDVVRSIVENLSLIESTRNIVDELDTNILESLGRLARRYASEFLGKVSNQSDFDMLNKSEVIFTIDEWTTSEGVIAGYKIGEFGGGCHYWMTSIVSADKDSSMFVDFFVDHNKIGLKKDAFRKKLKAWVNDRPNLIESGLSLGANSDVLELVFHLDPQAVIEDYPKFDACFEPMKQTIEKLLGFHKEFEEFVGSIRKDIK